MRACKKGVTVVIASGKGGDCLIQAVGGPPPPPSLLNFVPCISLIQLSELCTSNILQASAQMCLTNFHDQPLCLNLFQAATQLQQSSGCPLKSDNSDNHPIFCIKVQSSIHGCQFLLVLADGNCHVCMVEQMFHLASFQSKFDVCI